MSRRRYMVAYDIADACRLRKVHGVVKGYGYGLQYSLFLCDLSDMEKLMLKSALSSLIHHAEDRVAIIDLGEPEGRGMACFEFMGLYPDLPRSGGPVIV